MWWTLWILIPRSYHTYNPRMDDKLIVGLACSRLNLGHGGAGHQKKVFHVCNEETENSDKNVWRVHSRETEHMITCTKEEKLIWKWWLTLAHCLETKLWSSQLELNCARGNENIHFIQVYGNVSELCKRMRYKSLAGESSLLKFNHQNRVPTQGLWLLITFSCCRVQG